MKRFFIKNSEINTAFPTITGSEAHHITNVFRLKINDTIILIDNSGHEYKAQIASTSKNQVSVKILEKSYSDKEPPINLIVAQGYLKDKKMDMLIRHLTEIGISKWIPMTSKYSVPRPDNKRMLTKINRWETIAKEAVKQSRRATIPQIKSHVSFENALELSCSADLKIIFFENSTSPLKDIFSKTLLPSQIFLMIGPEGGFSENEIDSAIADGFIVASLGKRILRSETATISACTLIQYLFGDMC